MNSCDDLNTDFDGLWEEPEGTEAVESNQEMSKQNVHYISLPLPPSAFFKLLFLGLRHFTWKGEVSLSLKPATIKHQH